MEKIVVAMSGGVDSSMAGYLLLNKGMIVEGVFFVLFDNPPTMNFAREVAKFLGIKLHIEDLRRDFREKVIEPFLNGYKRGITPNPCILCNKYIKFPALKKLADRLNAKWFATGHYVRILKAEGRAFLLRGVDRNKDQSYFLYAIERELLQQLIFPLGEYTKDYVKALAEEVQLRAKAAEESVEACFLREKRYYELIKAPQGPIIEKSTGKIVGQHRGIHLFTIGQRKRLGVSLGYPAYVVHIDPSINAVYVASRQEAFWREFYVEDINWLCDPERNILECDIKIRYAMNPEKGRVSIINHNKAKVVFFKPQFAPTAGQSAVFYRNDIVLGGGIITGKERCSEVLQSHQNRS